MSNEEKTNKIITLALVVVITLAALTLIYVNLTEEKEEDKTQDQQDESGDEEPEETTLLTVIFRDEQINYTLEELETLETYTGIGQLIKDGGLPDNVFFEGPFNYTGVRISTFLDQFDDLPENYNLSVESIDRITEFDFSEIQGDIDIYIIKPGSQLKKVVLQCFLPIKKRVNILMKLRAL